MRTPLIAGNWKMHGSKKEVEALTQQIILETKQINNVEVVLCPSFVHLDAVNRLITNTTIKLGAQNLYHHPQGAFTGEVSGVMLKDLGCQYVLLGHSERRQLFHEGLSTVAQKFVAALDAGLHPILCIGETQAEHEAGKTNAIVSEQILSAIEIAGIEAFKKAVVAYEPVWAIGTGLTASPEKAEAMHAYIRDLFNQKSVAIAKGLRILYGGSMKPDNAKALLAQPNIDGGLVGGASLHANQFASICLTASSLTSGEEVAGASMK